MGYAPAVGSGGIYGRLTLQRQSNDIDDHLCTYVPRLTHCELVLLWSQPVASKPRATEVQAGPSQVNRCNTRSLSLKRLALVCPYCRDRRTCTD